MAYDSGSTFPEDSRRSHRHTSGSPSHDHNSRHDRKRTHGRGRSRSPRRDDDDHGHSLESRHHDRASRYDHTRSHGHGRSRSPRRDDDGHGHSLESRHHDRASRYDHTRSHGHGRSRSLHRDDDRHRHKRKRSRSPGPLPKPVKLPYKAKPLSKRQYDEYLPLFQSYLDIQKQLQLDQLDEREALGRWKSFVNRWNAGELARSWYDPSMLQSAQKTVEAYQAESPERTTRHSPSYTRNDEATGEDSDDDFGPAPPAGIARHRGHGPTVPKFDDLAYRNELRNEEQARERSDYADDMRYERKSDRRAQKERLEELAPRADPGSRERQLEKRRESTRTLHSFRDAKEGGDVEVAESDLMGDDGVDMYRRKRKEEERQKNEREIRREEIMRARAAEREERLSERREKESRTMDYLQQLARERYG